MLLRPASGVLSHWLMAGSDESAKSQRQDHKAPTQQSTLVNLDDVPSLADRAARFLDHDQIRYASDDDKKAFLRTKGLVASEIDSLFQDPLGTDQVRSSESKQQPNTDKPHSNSSPQSQPPIITYPEFLLHSQKPPPLITPQRLLTTTYAVSGAAAFIYAASKHLAEPMLESLTSSRHSLFEIASRNIRNLNRKLEDAVSTIPETIPKPRDHELTEFENEELDVTRHFSKTVATQTSPTLSGRPSESGDSYSAHSAVLISHTSKLAGLKASLEKLKPQDSEDQLVQQSIAELRGFLYQLSVPPDSPLGSKQLSSGNGDPHEDALGRVRAEIKAVKAGLLNARNFPSSLVR